MIGSAGLARGLLIVLLANSISVITSISLAAVATNLKVKGGGDYYLISRTLGKEFGGSLGLVLFLAQSVSIAFYTIGFAEALTAIVPALSQISVQLVAALTVLMLFPLAWKGADWATKFQYIVMALLGISLFSFFAGGLLQWDSNLLQANWARPENSISFWVLFAIFFPAVTGFTQGVSMSGDLQDPGKSIPRGTFWAVGLSLLTYFSVALVFAGALPNAYLATHYDAMKAVALNTYVVDAGVIAATLSSALASFMGAPRILQSLASDKVFPQLDFFAKTHRISGNPQRGVLLATLIALFTIALGQLDMIAGVVSMFFLVSYGLLNYATYYESKSNSPSFRPRFKYYSPLLSLTGALTCLVVMLAIDVYSGLFAFTVLFAIFQYIKRVSGPSRWADSTRSYHLQQVRNHLLAANEDPVHARDWRPQLLVFIDEVDDSNALLLEFSTWIEGGSGFVEAVHMVETGWQQLNERHDAIDLNQTITQNKLPIFPLVLHIKDHEEAVSVMLQSSGLGPLRPNSVVFPWLKNTETAFSGLTTYAYVKQLKLVFQNKKNLILFYANSWKYNKDSISEAQKIRIDIWWKGDASSRLMLLFAHLMTRTELWEKAKLRVLTKGDISHVEQEELVIQKLLEDIRIDAEPYIVQTIDSQSIIEHSKDAAFVFLPLGIEGDQIVAPNGESLERSLPHLRLCALVKAAEDIKLDATPEEGGAADFALARDNLISIQKQSAKADKMLQEKEQNLAALQEKLAHMQQSDLSEHVTSDDLLDLRNEIQKALDDTDKAYRKAKMLRAQAYKAALTSNELKDK